MASAAARILKKTTSLAGATFASRLLGFLREILMANALGGGAAASAWSLAFKIPNLFRRIFGEGLIGTVLIPMMAQTIGRHGQENARKRFSTIFMWLSLILCICSVAVSGIALLLRPCFEREHLVLACELVPLLMPYCIFICLIGVMTSILNSVKVFFLPAVFSLLLNLCMIAALLWVCPLYTGEPFRMLSALTYAVLLSGVLEFILLLMLLKKYGFLPTLCGKLFRRLRALKELWVLALPGLLGALAYQGSVLADGLIAAWISPYAAASLSYSERLIYLPVGVFAVAFGTVSLAEMSSLAQKHDYETLVSTQFASLRFLLFLTVPLTAFMCLFHEEILRLVYFRGAFDERALRETSQALFCYAFGIPAFSSMKVVLTGFYSRKDMKTPMMVSVSCMALNLVLNLLLMIPLKQGGIALATVIGSYLNNLILLGLLQKELKCLPLGQLARFFCLTVLLSLPGLWPAKWLYGQVNSRIGAVAGVGIFPSLAAAGFIFLAIFLILAILLRIDEVKTFSNRIFRKKGV